MTFSGLDWYWWLAIVAALTGLFIGRISNGLMVGVVYSKRHNNFLFPVSLTIIKSSEGNIVKKSPERAIIFYRRGGALFSGSRQKP